MPFSTQICTEVPSKDFYKRPMNGFRQTGIQYQAISGENFSQSEYVAFGAISQFAFPPLAKAILRAFDHVNLSNLCSKQAFHSINLSNVGFIIESQSVRIHIFF